MGPQALGKQLINPHRASEVGGRSPFSSWGTWEMQEGAEGWAREPESCVALAWDPPELPCGPGALDLACGAPGCRP